MKIQKLHIHNIASIIDATIDFTTEPLCDSDVFLITGDTGAGKTTILDSICLALFNNTPRLKKGKSVKVKNGIDELTLKDPRRLMRRNTGEAMVELFFEVNGVEYEAEWHVQRGKLKKTTVSIDNINRMFKNLSTDETITGVGAKDTELQAKIQEVIGLDFDQFTRTTMLAQNEFTKFLSSDEDDRAAILEKITKTSEFSAVGAKIYEITSKKEIDWRNALRDASDTGLSDEQIQDKNTQIEELTAEANQKKTDRDIADKKKTWLCREKELVDAEQKAQDAFHDANEQLQSEQYKNDCHLVEQWNATIDVRQSLKQQSETKETICFQENKLNEQRDKFLSVLNGQEYNKTELGNLDKEIDQITQYLKDNSAKVSTFENAQTIIGYLDTIIKKSEKTKELSDDIAKENINLNNVLVHARDNAKGTFDNAGKEKEELEKQIKLKDEELDGMNIAGLRSERDSIKDLLRDIDIAVSDVKAIKVAEDAYNQEKLRLNDVKKNINDDENTLNKELIPQLSQAETTKNVTEQARDMLKNSVDSFAKQMRTHLSVGCECPVCRQTVTLLPLEKEIDQLYADAENKFREAKTKFEKAESAKNKAEANLNAAKKTYNKDKQAFENDQSVLRAKEKAIASCLKCGISELTDNTLSDLENTKITKQTYLDDELNKKIAAGESVETNLRKLRAQQPSQNDKFEKARQNYEKAQQVVIDSENKIRTYGKSLGDNKNELENAQTSVRPLIADVQWQHDWTIEPEQFKAELDAATKEYNAKKDRRGKIEVEKGPKRTSFQQVDDLVAEIRRTQSDWKELIATATIRQDNLFSLANGVLQEVGRINTIIQDAKNKNAESVQKINAFLALHPELTIQRIVELNSVSSVANLARELESKRQLPGQKKALWDNSQKEHQNHQAIKPELLEDDTYESCDKAYTDADNAMTELNNKIAVIKEELKSDAQKKKGVETLKQKADEAFKEYDKWQRLNRIIGDKEGKTFRTIAQSYIFDGLLNSANGYLQKLEPRYMLKTIPGTLYSSLEDAYQGFASRDTSSLSGGESFLVSLALALALSDIGQGLSVDTLFIDEGFGSLSGVPLTNAINTLRSLHGQSGRHVGIISHIQEVRDNIPVQIQVKQSGGSSSSTIEVCEVQ